ncbi:MADS-box transcription factor [Parasponia andersonii]|uniref:MADS-box transcription factor n=1 Tax=Parasponia andersonii TaxID=3476 RepID=A0A2P5DLH1_PARAD|nr:MADS-box transcription factor [Parasponia andersonii]
MVKRRIDIQKIENKEHRLVSFSKRWNGLFKKAHELSSLTGAQIAILVLSEFSRPYFHASPPSFITQLLNPEFSVGASTSSSSSPELAVESSSWLRYLLDFEVEGCEEVDELVAAKEKLEEMREKAAMALDLNFANSLLSTSGDLDDDDSLPSNVDDSMLHDWIGLFEGCISSL